MVRTFLTKTFSTLTEAFQNCLKRFPITVCFAIALTGYLIYWVTIEKEERLFFIIAYYLSIGTLLSLTLHLWCEEIKKTSARIITQAVAHVLLIADSVFLYYLSPEESLTEITIAHGAGIFALGISTFFLSFTKEKNDIASWNFTLSSLTYFVTACAIGSIMSGGINLLVFSLHQLFDWNIDSKWYIYITVVCNILLAIFLFLGLLPQGAAKHDRTPLSKSFLNTVIHYLFIPLLSGYLIVLYIYAARILVKWELPIGWVSWLVTTLMAGCIAVEFGLYPSRMANVKKADNRIARYLPVLILPLLILMTIGIARRFNDYGITINRLYLITFNAWCYMVCIGLFITKAKRINWIPISFAVIFLLTSVLPINYSSITRNTLRNDILKELKLHAYDMPLSEKEYTAWVNTLPPEKARSINDKIMYLHSYFGEESLSDLFSERIDAVLTTNADKDILIEQRTSAKTIIEIPKGYGYFIEVSQIEDISNKNISDGILPVPVNDKDKGITDTVYLDLKALGSLADKYPREDTPPQRIKCKLNEHLFISTYINVTRFANEGHTSVNLSGYLFIKNN